MTIDRHLGPSTDHVWFGGDWRAEADGPTWAVSWAPATGRLSAVDDSGVVEVLGVFADRRVVDELMAGWPEAQGEEGSLYGLRHRAAEAFHQAPLLAADPPSRSLGTRYRVELDDGRWWELGWDRPLATYYAQLHDPIPYDPFTPPDLLAWRGTSFGELPDVPALEQATGLTLSTDMAADLSADQAAFPAQAHPTLVAVPEAFVEAPAPREFRAWVESDPDRQVEHVDLGSAWIADSDDVRRLGWVPTTGEVYAANRQDAVEILGIIPSRSLLDAALHGAVVRHGVEGGLHWARAAIREAEEELLFGRVGGYDRDYAAWLAVEPARRVPHHDFGDGWTAEESGRVHRVSWVPTTGELYAVELAEREEGFVEVLGVFATTAAIEETVPNWDSRMPRSGSLYWLRDTIGRGISERFDLANHSPQALVRRNGQLDMREAQLDGRAKDLDRRERQLASQHQAVATAIPVEPRWTLPAAPVAEILLAIQAGTGDDLPDVARGCGLDPTWAAEIASGQVTEVDVPHVQEVCEGLHCSPYDLWGKDAAQGILHAYGPELWPRLIEPLEPPPVELPGLEPPDLSL